jgi:PAS domain S-box-containing protein
MPLLRDPGKESARLAALRALGVLDTPADSALDALVRAAAALCDAPISLVSLIDAERQWFKANHGLPDVAETPRDWSFCSHAIATGLPMEVPDASRDARFAVNPLVTGDPGIRFYFGVPLALTGGERVGTLCVIDRVPRRLSSTQRLALGELGTAVTRLLERQPVLPGLDQGLRQRALEELAASSSQSILLTDAAGRTVWANKAFTELSGYPLAELIGRRPGTLLQTAETDPAAVARIRAAMAARQICQVDLLNVRRDGRRYWTALEIHPVFRQHGGLAGFIGFQQDITARKQIEQQLAESRLLLEQAAGAANFGAGYLDLASGRICWDPLCARMFDVAADFEPTLDGCLALLSTESAERFRTALARSIATRETMSVEMLRILPDGAERWLQVSGRIEFREEQPLRLIGGLLDVTARKRVEQELADSQAFLEQAVNVLDFAPWRLDARTGAVRWEQNSWRILGMPADFVPTLDNCLDFYPDAVVRADVAQRVQDAILTRQPFDFEAPIRTGDGRDLWVRVVGKPELDETGQVIGVIGGTLDISRQHALQQELTETRRFLEQAGRIAGVGAYRVDLEAGITEWSPQTCRMHDVPEDFRPTLEQAIAFYAPEERPMVERLVGEAIAQEGRFEFELPLVTARGRRIWVHATGEVFHEADGRRVLVGGVVDVTAQHLQRQALEESHRRIALANAAGGIGTWEWRIAEGVLYWDEGTTLLMGAPTTDASTGVAQWMSLIHPDDRERVGTALEAVLAGTGADWAIEFRTADGGDHDRHLATAARIQRDAAGQPRTITGVTWDITEQRQLTDRLQTQAEEMRWQLALGAAITRAQRAFIHEAEPHRAYDALLEDLLALTGSDYGFVGEVHHEAGHPILRTRAVTDLSWDEDSRQLLARIHTDGLDFRRLGTLISAPLLSGEPLLSSDPALDPRRGGLPPGHPPLHNFLAIPVLDTAGVVAMVGLANRPAGFDLGLIEQLQPLLATIGQLVRAEAAMRTSREGKQRLAATIEAARVGTWEWNVQTGELLINERWAGMLGYSVADLMPTSIGTWYQLGHPQDLERAHALLLANFRNEFDYYDSEFRLRHKAGHWVWVHARGRIASRDGSDRPLKMYGTHTDITERKRAEAGLLQNEARLRALFELSPVGITLQDVETRKVLDANPAILQMLGFSHEEHLQHDGGALTPPEQQEDSLRELRKLLESGSYGPLEKELYHKDGSRVPVRLQGRSFRDDDGRPLVWSMIEDLSHSRRVDRMKREFVSVVSHELRTPLTALRGALGLLKRLPASTTGPGAELLGIAEQNCLRLGFLVDDLLDMERLTTGKLRLELTAVPVAPLLNEATGSHRTYLSGRHGSIRVVEPVPAVAVQADRQRLIQVLSNLLSNALKFSPPGGVVDLGVDQLGQRLRFWVQDQGPGIPEDFRERIFERFAQADASDTRRMGGSGLGLAIVRELMQLMDGRVGFVSEPGRGARFWIDLPIAESDLSTTLTEGAR